MSIALITLLTGVLPVAAPPADENWKETKPTSRARSKRFFLFGPTRC
jgi:hypothetical protein